MQLCALIMHTHYRSFNKFFPTSPQAMKPFKWPLTFWLRANQHFYQRFTGTYVITLNTVSFSKEYFGVNSFSMHYFLVLNITCYIN